ncbi:MAG: hypothetical protein R2705_08850 [Ilumatobacteraceae bacterium]
MAAADRPDELHPGSEDLDGADHPCAVLLHEAANGRFPPADGNVEFFAPDDFGTCAAVGFTGHAVVLTPPGPRPERPSAPFGFGGVHEPNFLLSLAGPGGELGSLDVVLVARGTGRAGPTERSPERLTETDAHDRHPRVLRAATVVTFGARRRAGARRDRCGSGRSHGTVRRADGRCSRTRRRAPTHPGWAGCRGPWPARVRPSRSRERSVAACLPGLRVRSGRERSPDRPGDP